jgi:ATP-binding cassette subfamily B protein
VIKASKGGTALLAATTLAGAVLPLAVAIAGKRIVDAVVAHDHALAVRWVAIELALVVAAASVQRLLSVTRTLLGNRLGIDVNVAILEKALTLELPDFEDPDFYDRLVRARREASSRPVQLVSDAFSLVQNVLTLVGSILLLVRFRSWALPVLLVATLPATIAEMRFAKVTYKLRNWRSPDSRRLSYLEYVLANDAHAKEVKLLGLGPLFLGRYRDLSEQFDREDRALTVKRGAVGHALSLLATFAFYGGYLVMALAAVRGDMSLGDMTLYVVAFRQGQQAFQSALGGAAQLYEHNLYMSNLFSFLAGEGATKRMVRVPREANGHASGANGVNGATGAVTTGITFEDVGFRYPGRNDWAVRHVSFHVPPGQSVALVGQNGAGKTTLIKLLTGLYQCTEGRILLDGRDLESFTEAELHHRFGVVFQDFNRYMLPLGENVGVGSVGHLGDEPRITRALTRGGGADLLDKLNEGIQAPLGRWFRGGTELSGGQWQKIALARAFMREEADILILDEPTAALDAEAEAAVFTRFRELSKGRTTFVISHRFPTVRASDRIFVLENGEVKEQGTHDELVAQQGRYAALFALQASGYRD